MQYAAPTKESDVTVAIDGNSNAGTDHNGLVVGRWKTGLFGCMDSLVPNGVMSCCCSGLVVAQISARLGMMSFMHVLGLFGALYFWAFLSAIIDSSFMDAITVIGCLIAALCCTRMRWRIRTLFSIPGSPMEDAVFSVFCGCCSIAQMASHVESYEPGCVASVLLRLLSEATVVSAEDEVDLALGLDDLEVWFESVRGRLPCAGLEGLIA